MAEALRLADALENDLEDYGGQSLPRISQDIADGAAAELRRLHAENERLHAQRDALLEVLKYIAKQFRQHGRQHWPEAVAARLAIEAVEGETK